MDYLEEFEALATPVNNTSPPSQTEKEGTSAKIHQPRKLAQIGSNKMLNVTSVGEIEPKAQLKLV